MSKSPIHNTPAKILGLSPEELEKIKEQFPYFNSARMLLLKKHQSTGEASDRELSSSAVWSSDRRKMNDFLKKRARSEYPPIAAKEEKPIAQESYTSSPPQIQQPVTEIKEQAEEHTASIAHEQSYNGEIVIAEEVQQTPAQEENIAIETTVEIQPEQIEAVQEMQPVYTEEIDNTPTLTSEPSAKLEPEEDYTEEEESKVPMPEARKFIIVDHTFDEWLDHFKKGKQSVKQSLEDKPKAAEDAADELDRLIESSLPATFFHDKLESETQYAKGLETFIDKQKKKKATVSKPAETGLVTETLAKIYERQGLVDKALGVYEQLILKNPEKSAYFAVQIERLKNK